MKARLLLVTLLAALITPVGCVSAREKLEARYAEGLRPFSVSGLEMANLEIVWEQDLTDEKGKTKLKETYLLNDLLLVESDDEILYAYNRHTGDLAWLARLPVGLKFEPTAFDGKLYCTCGSRLIIINEKGIVTIGPKFPVSVSAPFAMTGEYIYAAASGGVIHKLAIDDLTDAWTSPAKTAGPVLNRIELMGPYIVFGSTAGEIVAIDIVTSGRQANFRARDSVTGGVAIDDAYIYAGSADFYVYSITVNGTLRWKQVVGGPVFQAPVLSGDYLYATVMGGGIQALTKQEGKILWKNYGAIRFLSDGGGDVFAMANQKELWVLDAGTGEVEARLDVAEFNIIPTNKSNDGLVYLVSKDGRIVVLRSQ